VCVSGRENWRALPEVEIALLSHMKLESNPRFAWLVESLAFSIGIEERKSRYDGFVDPYLGLSRLTKVSCVLVFKDNLSIYVNFFVISARVKRERERERETPLFLFIL